MERTNPTFKRTTPRQFAAIRIDQLWTIVILAGIGTFIALVPTPPNDFWWHLKAGQLVAQSGIPITNLFAWTLPADTPYVYATWLGEWLFYALYSVGGLGLIVIARNVLGLLGFALVALEAQRRSGSWRLAALATLFAAAMAINNLIIRTQIWSWVPFGLFMLILGGYAAGQTSARTLFALPVVMAFWVNAHGAFVLGIGLALIYAFGETLRMLLKQPGALVWERLRWLYAATVGSIVATVINPLGFGIFGYVLKLLTDPPSQGLIVEWQPPTTRNIAGAIFYAAILLLLVALAYARRRPSVTDLLLMCAFLWLAWGGVRYVVWFGMVAMPILAQTLSTPRAAVVRPRRTSPANLVIVVAMVLALLAVQPPLKNALPLPAEYRAIFSDALPDAPLSFSDTTPVRATAWLRANVPPNSRVFNEMGYGSYLDWALYPQVQVFVDPRVELYPLALWQDYVAITNATDYNALLDKHTVTHVMLDRKLQPKLDKAIRTDTRWVQIYEDVQTGIYRRR